MSRAEGQKPADELAQLFTDETITGVGGPRAIFEQSADKLASNPDAPKTVQWDLDEVRRRIAAREESMTERPGLRREDVIQLELGELRRAEAMLTAE